MKEYAQFIRPTRGFWLRCLLNLLLRISVKWQHGLHIDIVRLRKVMGWINARAARQYLKVERLPVDCDGVAAEWLTPMSSDPSRVLLYLHGGAFITRSPDAHAGMVAGWCEQLGTRALMVDYRLAPEHAYPAGIDDCHTAYRWLIRQGYKASDIVLAGDSAGGNLALALLQRIKAAAEAMPCCAVLLSPFVDFTLSGASAVRNARRDPMFTLAFASGFRRFYAQPESFLNSDVSPLFGDFEGLPPLLLQVGSSEMLLDDSLRVAERAHAVKVPVQLEVWDRLPHVFQALGVLPQAREANQRIVDFISCKAGWALQASPLNQPAMSVS